MQDVKAFLIAKVDDGEVMRYAGRNIEQAKVPIRSLRQPGREADSAPDLTGDVEPISRPRKLRRPSW